MRKTSVVKKSDCNVRRVIVHESKNGVYLFPCASLEDEPAIGDQWFETVADADAVCLSAYGIGPNDWEIIDDPLEGCQQDWIAPVRVKGRNTGKPQWGQFERLENGEWKDVQVGYATADDNDIL